MPEARKALRALLPERITLTPAMQGGRKVYRFEGKTPVGALIDNDFIKMASPRGSVRYLNELPLPFHSTLPLP